MSDPIVGHKTFAEPDGTLSHTPLLKSEADALWAASEAKRKEREALMPTEHNAREMFFSAWLRLKELGWKDAIYCPKDGTPFDVIEAGSTGVYRCLYEGAWPDGRWWVEDHGDLYPSRPALYRPLAGFPCPSCRRPVGTAPHLCATAEPPFTGLDDGPAIAVGLSEQGA